MEYTSQKELYLSLLPVFNVKRRLLLYGKYNNITNEDIWKYLSVTKWKNSINLTISDMVSDIINLDDKCINKIKGEKK